VPRHPEQSAPAPEQAVAPAEVARPWAPHDGLMARLLAAARSARRRRLVREQRSAQPAWHWERHCPGAVQCAATEVVYPRRRAAVQFESAGQPQVGRPMQEAIALRPPAAVQFESVARLPAARLMPEAALRQPAAEQELARSSAEAAAVAQRLAEPEALVAQAAARQPEESAGQDVASVRAAAASDAQVGLLRAAQNVAGVPRPEAEARVATVLLREAAPAGLEVRQREARDAAGVLPRAAPGVRAAARPSAEPWVCHRDQAPPWPALSPAVLFARAMERLRIASP
jgi:hypothetical protein